MLRRKSLFESTFIAGVALAALGATPANAQQPATPPAPTDTATPPPAAPAPDDNTAEETVVITGSRIKTTEFNAPSPIQVLTSEQADLRGLADSGRFLQSASVAAGSSQVDTKISSAFVTEGGPGASTIALRGLGSNRTLVLLNGRRAGPAGVRGGVSAVDLNVIPESSIERIDILKDGASSIYGSDAVAGVVNIITKKDYSGGEIESFGSVPFEQGGDEYRVNASYGKTFNRARFGVAADYYRRHELKIGDRTYTSCAEDYIFDPITNQRKDLIDPFTNKFQCGNLPIGQIWSYDYDHYITPPDDLVGPNPPNNNSFGQGDPVFLQYDASGQIGVFSPGSIFPTPVDTGDMGAPPNWYVVHIPGNLDSSSVEQENHPFIQDAGIDPDVQRSTLYFDGDVDITPSIKAYTEVLLNRRVSKLTGYRQFWDFQFTQDFYEYGDGLGDPLSNFKGPWLLSPTGIIDWGDTEQKVDYGRFVGGFKGKLGFLEGWDWDIFTQYSKSSGDYITQQILKDAVDAQTRILAFGVPGAGGTCVGQVLLNGTPCQDFNFEDPDFLQGNWSQAARDFFLDTETGHTDYTQTTVEGVVSGDLFSLPAGPVGTAIGFSVRKDEIKDVPGAITLAGNAWETSSAGITQGDDKTEEFFGEIRVPILKDQPFFKDLSFSGSARKTKVETSGDATTYKAGLNWQVTPAVRFRATKGTSFRAPALFELYLAAETGSARLGTTDPCINVDNALLNGNITQELHDNCLDPLGPGGGVDGTLSGSGIDAVVSSSGGLGRLTPETSEATSLGIVLTPPDSNLSIAIDYFDIQVSNEVTKLGARNILLGCYTSNTFPADPLCSLFTRVGIPGANNLDTITNDFVNVATQNNRGVDVTVRYVHDIASGRMTMNGQLTWQLEDVTQLFPDSPPSNTNGNVGDPTVVGNTEVRYDLDDWTFQWSMQFIGPSDDTRYCVETSDCFASASNPASAFDPYYSIVSTPFISYHDFSVRKRFDDWSVLVGLSNAFDTPPPRLTSQGFNAGAYQDIPAAGAVGVSQYDLVGRRAFVNVSKQF